MPTESKIKDQIIKLLSDRDISIREISRISGVPFVTIYNWIYNPDSINPKISTIEKVLASLGFSLQIVSTTGRKTVEEVKAEKQLEQEKLGEKQNMKKYVCNDCGEVFDESEVALEEFTESRGECWGSLCSETVVISKCPHCGSENYDNYYDHEDFLDEDDF